MLAGKTLFSLMDYNAGPLPPPTLWNMPVHIVRQHAIRAALMVTIPSSALAALIKVLDHNLKYAFLEEIMPDGTVYSTFTFIIGFFVVFHTSHSYQRMMKGAEMLYTVMADFCDVATLVFAYSRASGEDPEKVMAFKQQYLRLMSLFFAVNAGELEENDHETFLEFALIDFKSLGDLDSKALVPSGSASSQNVLQRVSDSPHKAEVVSQMILSFLVDNIRTGILTIPPPLLSRVFNVMGEARIKFFEVRVLKEIPFPIPLLVTADVLLFFHGVMTPFFMANWSMGVGGAVLYTFITVFCLVTLHLVASELDCPFGQDVNDLPMALMQERVNARFLSILRESNCGPLPEVPASDLESRYRRTGSGSMGIRNTLHERSATPLAKERSGHKTDDEASHDGAAQEPGGDAPDDADKTGEAEKRTALSV